METLVAESIEAVDVLVSGSASVRFNLKKERDVLHAYPYAGEGPRNFCPWCLLQGKIGHLLLLLGIARTIECSEVHIHMGDMAHKAQGSVVDKSQGRWIIDGNWDTSGGIGGCSTVPNIPGIKWVP
jgi:hypothetical protein